MKKITIMLALLVCSLASQVKAQDVISVKTVYSSIWNDKTSSWDREPEVIHPTTMTITLQGNLILVTDRVNSNYRTGAVDNKKDDKEIQSTTWYATDEKNRECLVQLNYYKKTGNKYLVIIYDSFKIAYEI